jgi:CheY-like chemotaxis protein
MKILIVEDRGAVAIPMRDVLAKEGHDVTAIYSTLAAEERIANEGVDCLIVDLNMPANGLSVVERQSTVGAVLTGWIWLRERVFSKRPELKDKTIIYSEYMDSLEKNVSAQDLKGIYRVRRRGSEVQATKVLEYVREIEKAGKK